MPIPTMSQSVEGVSYLAAFGGGVVSFASPCVLPIVPAYLSVITGLDVAEVRSGPRQHLGRITRDTSLFVAGFSAVFILLGLSATAVGQVLFRNHLLLTRLSGVAVLVDGGLPGGLARARAPEPVVRAGLRASWMYGEARFHPSPSRFGPLRRARWPEPRSASGGPRASVPSWPRCSPSPRPQGRALEGAALLACYSLGPRRAVPGHRAGVGPARRCLRLGQAALHGAHVVVGGGPGRLRGPARPRPAHLGDDPAADRPSRLWAWAASSPSGEHRAGARGKPAQRLERHSRPGRPARTDDSRPGRPASKRT